MSRPRAGGIVAAMARFLIATLPADGHLSPLLPLARELHARGHEVFWHTGSSQRGRVEATGAALLPFIDARDLDYSDLDAQFPGRAEPRGFRRFRFDIREIVIKMVPDQVADLQRHIANAQPDLLIAEPAVAAAASIVHERCGLPWVRLPHDGAGDGHRSGARRARPTELVRELYEATATAGAAEVLAGASS
jgi:UDP:flavonoid glycosyltransferase YjiC (YdhE family)